MEMNTRRLIGKILVIANPFNYSLANIAEIFSSYSLNQGAVLSVALVLGIIVLILEHLAIAQKKYRHFFEEFVPAVQTLVTARSRRCAAREAICAQLASDGVRRPLYNILRNNSAFV